jgi:hypothetical protein
LMISCNRTAATSNSNNGVTACGISPADSLTHLVPH